MSHYSSLPDFGEISKWVNAFVDTRLVSPEKPFAKIIADLPLPELSRTSAMGDFIREYKLTPEAIFILFFIYEYTINFEIIDKLVEKSNVYYLHPESGRFAPTGYTLVRLITGESGKGRQEVLNLFRNKHAFNRRSIIQLSEPAPKMPEHGGVVKFVDGIFEMFSTNKFLAPRFGPGFPAELVTTESTLDDLMLPKYTLEDINLIMDFPEAEYEMRYEEGFDTFMMKGYRVLFSGPPGTGKTMTAAIMGKKMHRDVYRVDISRVTSKYIGETEKNLSRLFSMAEGKGWILFFDEADALFGNRIEDGKSDSVSAGHRNEMISYLLQRIESYNGMVLAATNLPDNIDVAFKRRFQEHIHFPLPGKEMSAQLWDKYLPKKLPFEKTVTMEYLIKDILPPASINKICCKLLHRILYYDIEYVPFTMVDKLIKDEKRSLNI